MLPNQLNLPKAQVTEEKSLYRQSVSERSDQRQEKSARQFEKALADSKQQLEAAQKRNQQQKRNEQSATLQKEQTSTSSKPANSNAVPKSQNTEQEASSKSQEKRAEENKAPDTQVSEQEQNKLKGEEKNSDTEEVDNNKAHKTEEDVTGSKKKQDNGESSELTKAEIALQWQSNLTKGKSDSETNSITEQVENTTSDDNESESSKRDAQEQTEKGQVSADLKKGVELDNLSKQVTQEEVVETANIKSEFDLTDTKLSSGDNKASNQVQQEEVLSLDDVFANLSKGEKAAVQAELESHDESLENLIKIINYAKPDKSAEEIEIDTNTKTGQEEGEGDTTLGFAINKKVDTESTDQEIPVESNSEFEALLAELATQKTRESDAPVEEQIVASEQRQSTENEGSSIPLNKSEITEDESAEKNTRKSEQELTLNNQIRFALSASSDVKPNPVSGPSDASPQSIEGLTSNSYIQWQNKLSKNLAEQQANLTGGQAATTASLEQQLSDLVDENIVQKEHVVINDLRQSSLQAMANQTSSGGQDNLVKASQVEVMGVQLDKALAQPKLESAANVKQDAMIKENILFNKQELAANMQQQVSLMMARNLKSVDIRLDPPELGSMQVKLNLSGEQAAVSFVVSSQQAKDALEGSLPKLRELLEQQGMQLADSDVKQEKGQTGDGHAGENGEGQLNGNHEDDIEQEEVAATLMQHNVNSPWNVDYYA